MDKVLELSKKIYESGFQPDYIEIGDGLLDLYISGEGVDFEFEDPWFSSDWCWKMLPQEIKLKINMSVIINDSLHEALLELVCWCIDNGHLKGEN